jgi:hypothetical protein
MIQSRSTRQIPRPEPSFARNSITKVTYTQNEAHSNIQLVVWQFWGRAAEAS